MLKNYVSYDHNSNSLNINLPDELIQESDAVKAELQARFGYDSMNDETLKKMNTYIQQRLEKTGS